MPNKEFIGPSCLVGLIGDGIMKSRTPGMHMREGKHQGIRHIYNLIDTGVLGLGQKDLPDLLTAAVRMGYKALTSLILSSRRLFHYLMNCHLMPRHLVRSTRLS